ncbi:26S proteasome non-ATPase regulatory subunit 9 [Cryptosporidium felis]|nr:26S proteasome non-ATPase regulatory subunit 9 [Cryptosporidium felis]
MDELNNRKTDIEKEVNELMEFLNSCGPDVGLKGNLVDDEGFPRSDVDLYAVRRARNRIAVLNTDYTRVMKEIEERLFDIHSREKIYVPVNKPTSQQSADGNASSFPFGFVDSVLEDSPAFLSGMRPGDLILEFGDLKSEVELVSQEESKKQILRVSEIILNNLEKPIKVVILRNKTKQLEDLLTNYSINNDHSDLGYKSLDLSELERRDLWLTPKEWNGSGYLGCHMAYFRKFAEM